MVYPVLEFGGCCAEAIDFYAKVFDAENVEVRYYGDAPDGSGMSDSVKHPRWVMHSGIELGGGYVNMHDSENGGGTAILNVTLPTAEDVTRVYNRLAEGGGRVAAELGPQFFNEMYGAVTDRFGIRWQLMVGHI